VAIEPLTRRSVLQGALVAAVAAVIGFVAARNRRPAPDGTAAANSYGARESSGAVLAPLAQVPVGGGLVLRDRRIVLTRGEGDAVHGFSAACTHQGCLVSGVSAGAIDCPCHGSRFDATTGAVLQGPATRPLPAVAVAVQGDDVVTT
jgi:Rieske Fe-S protein